MRYWIGLTDYDWYEFLTALAPIDDVNFWQPGGRMPVRLTPGAPFLFKLHAPRGGWIVGGGYFAHYTRLPARVAWDTFGESNGAASFEQMKARIVQYRRGADVDIDPIGCMALVEPFFLPRGAWIRPPADWAGPTQVGKTYDSDQGEGARVWEEVRSAQVVLRAPVLTRAVREVANGPRYGEPMELRLRLGQGTFRAKVIDAYERRCAITGERTLPVLEAAHIRPYSAEGPHAPENGLLLRSDLHTLFDRGYLTVTPALSLHVSRRIRDEFENGRDYYAFEGRSIRLPPPPNPPPAREYLEWHGDVVFRG